jgi:transcription antitermination factor NusG
LPRHEKRIAKVMADRQIECFLPLYQAERQWKKRPPVTLEVPLFPTYLFARIAPLERGRVLGVPGVLSIIGNGRQSVPVPDEEIDVLRAGLQLSSVEPHPYLAVGERVRVKHGPLTGYEGLLVRRKGSCRVVISVELIMQSISVEVDASELEPASVSSL